MTDDGAPIPIEQEITEIEADLAAARADMSATVDKLSDRLNPKVRADEEISKARDAVEEHQGEILAGVAGLVLVLFLLLWLRRRRRSTA